MKCSQSRQDDAQAVRDCQRAALVDLAWRRAGGPCRQPRINFSTNWAESIFLSRPTTNKGFRRLVGRSSTPNTLLEQTNEHDPS